LSKIEAREFALGLGATVGGAFTNTPAGPGVAPYLIRPQHFRNRSSRYQTILNV